MKKSVVIITHSADNASIDKVSARIQESGLNVIRFNTDKYPTEYMLEAELCSDKYQHRLITSDGTSVSSSQIHSIWYRRFYTGQSIDPKMESQMRQASVEESKRCIIGLLTCADCLKVDDYWSVKKASNKDYQLKIASEIGFDLPATLVTNSPNAARRFFDEQQGRIITKMQTSFAVWKNGREQVVFTNEVKEHHLERLDGLHQCPMVFQENIRKALELRVTVVGKRVFCAAIDSSAHANMQTDWRKRGSDTLSEWFGYSLPEDLQQKILLLCSRLDLHYGAIDIIVTPENEYKFLEINPCGEFYWMDAFTKLDICDAIADQLVLGQIPG